MTIRTYNRTVYGEKSTPLYSILDRITDRFSEKITTIANRAHRKKIIQRFIFRVAIFLILYELELIKIDISKGNKTKKKESVEQLLHYLISSVNIWNFINILFFDFISNENLTKRHFSQTILGLRVFFNHVGIEADILKEKIFEGKKEREITIPAEDIIKSIFIKGKLFHSQAGETPSTITDKISVIGEIYETFLVKRKAFGAFYTPKNIAEYMAIQAIKKYLIINSERKSELNTEALLEKILRGGNFNNKELKQIEYLFDVIRNIRICDIACGAGIFLLSAAKFLFKFRTRIFSILSRYKNEHGLNLLHNFHSLTKPSSFYFHGIEIIEKNLHGIDLMEEAIETTKIILWLWLRSLGESKVSFTDLCFNLHLGNSLIGFGPKTIIKSEVQKQDDDISLNKRYISFLKQHGIEINNDELATLRPFNWSSFYQEGFDIIISNPPYINIYTLSKLEKQIFSKLYHFTYKKYDLYLLFIERALELLRDQGILAFITSDKWIAAEYGYKARINLSQSRSIFEIVDLRIKKAFKSLEIRNIIFFLAKSVSFDSIVIKGPDFKQINVLPYEFIYNHPKCHFRLDLSQQNYSLIQTIMKDSTPLSKYCYVNWGCRPSPAKRYVFNKKEDCINNYQTSDCCKKLLKGKNIERYHLKGELKWVLYDKKMYNPMFPELFESDRIVIKDIGIKPIKATFIQGYKKLYSDHTTINIILKTNLPAKRRAKESVYKEDIELKFILALINSKLMNFYVKLWLTDGLHILPNNTKSLPIKRTKHEKLFSLAVEVLLFLNEKKEKKREEVELIQFIDHELLNAMVYLLYLENLLDRDNNTTRLFELIKNHLDAIEDKNSVPDINNLLQMFMILKNDDVVQQTIKAIKENKWVRIIENLVN